MAIELRGRPEALTTVYCPGVQFRAQDETWDWEYLQLVIPGEMDPLGKLKGEEAVEVLCRVAETNAVQWHSN